MIVYYLRMEFVREYIKLIIEINAHIRLRIVGNGVTDFAKECLDMVSEVDNPAKYCDQFIPIFANYLKDVERLCDPMAGSCKIGMIRDFGFKGKIWCNEIEPEFIKMYYVNKYAILISNRDAANMWGYNDECFDGICTSPTYGNRLADWWDRHDNSKRISYGFALGRRPVSENTAGMHWGDKYREKSYAIWKEQYRLLCKNGILICNVSDFIKDHKIVPVVEFHRNTLMDLGLSLTQELIIPTQRMRFGQNWEARVDGEHILIFAKE